MHKGFLLTWLYVLPSALSSLAAILLVWCAATFLASLPQGGEQAAFSISIYALVLAQIGALLTLFFGGPSYALLVKLRADNYFFVALMGALPGVLCLLFWPTQPLLHHLFLGIPVALLTHFLVLHNFLVALR